MGRHKYGQWLRSWERPWRANEGLKGDESSVNVGIGAITRIAIGQLQLSVNMEHPCSSFSSKRWIFSRRLSENQEKADADEWNKVLICNNTRPGVMRGSCN
jgi:hypothetical protein